MIKNVTRAYADRLNTIFLEEVMNNPKYMYYFSTSCNNISIDADKLCDNWQHTYLVSVDKDDNILGYITYSTDYCSKSCYSIGIIGFKGSPIFGSDIVQTIDDIFNVKKFNRISIFVYADNPVFKSYERFFTKVGGIQSGYATEEVLLADMQLHDSVTFELMARNYKRLPGYRYADKKNKKAMEEKKNGKK